MTQLPPGWAETTLPQIISDGGLISDGDWVESKDQDPDGDIRLIQLADIGDGIFKDKSSRYMNQYKADLLKCTFLESGDVLIARMPDPLGRACIFSGIKVRSVTVVDVCLVRLPEGSGLLSKILMYWINSPDIRNKIEMQATGTTRKRITRKNLSALKLPIPPLPEQIRIANKLDSLLAKVETAQTRLEKIPALLKRFRQAVLAAATSGELTNSDPDSWQNETLSKLASHIVDCPHSTPKWEEQGRLCVRTTAFNPFHLDMSDHKYVSEETYQERITRLKPMSGDILYSREGAILGVACQIPEGVELCLGQRMLLIRAGETINPKYLTIILNSEVITKVVKSLIIGNAAPRINMSAIRNFKILLPSLDEQAEIVRRVESLFAMADTVDKQYQAAKARLDKLTQAILAKAFRGELVPQDPNDEPAAELLKRIQAGRK